MHPAMLASRGASARHQIICTPTDSWRRIFVAIRKRYAVIPATVCLRCAASIARKNGNELCNRA
jgi:hypothetical protein